MKIELTQQAEQHTLYVRFSTSVDKLPEEFDKKYALLEGYLSEIGERPASAPYGAYYNQDMLSLDVEMGFPVAKALPGRGEIKSGTLPAFEKAVSCVHKGPYSSLCGTYNQVYQYIADSKFEQAGAHYDFYINDPDGTPEEELLTRIVIPVKERAETGTEKMVFCQSCGMPMQNSGDFGTDADGGRNGDYCVYCFKDGAFTADITMEEMIAFCAGHVDDWGMGITKEDAVAMMRENFPKLKRWRTA